MGMKEVQLGVFSLWTQIPMFRLERGPLLIHTLSVCQAARVFPELKFVTDAQGAQLAESLGWCFAKIETSLEGYQPEGLQHIWALGKLAACELQDRPFVHLDGDVILLKSLPRRVTCAPMIAQSQDHWHYYEGSDMDVAYTISGLPRHLPKFNAGLIGGTNIGLVREFTAYSRWLAEKFRDCPLNGTTTSMMVEQNALGVFAEQKGVQIGTIIATPDDERGAELAGYTHLHGSAKHDEHWIHRAELRLAREFPETYQRMLEGLAALNLNVPSPVL
jgi:hypothetical protein